MTAKLGVVPEVIPWTRSLRERPQKSLSCLFVSNNTTNLKNRPLVLQLNLADHDSFLSIFRKRFPAHRGPNADEQELLPTVSFACTVNNTAACSSFRISRR